MLRTNEVDRLKNEFLFFDTGATNRSAVHELIGTFGQFKFYWHKGGTSILPSEEIVALIDDAWLHDYGRTNQAVFKYSNRFIEWFTQKDSCDAVLVRDASGKLAGFLAISKRVFFHDNEQIPILFGTLWTVAVKYRKLGLAVKINDMVLDVIVPRYHMMYMGAFDGKMKHESFKKNMVDSDEAKSKEPFWVSRSKLLALWAATNNLATLHCYMPLPRFLAKIALYPPLRKVLEFRYKEPQKMDYEVSLVSPSGINFAPNFTGVGFVKNETLELLYGPSHPDVAGTYQVRFETGEYCEFYFIKHVATKPGLPDAQCAQIQIVDRGTASNRQLARGLQIVNHEFFKAGCIVTLIQNWSDMPLATLLLARFLPSDRKLGFQLGSFYRLRSKIIDMTNVVLFDLV